METDGSLLIELPEAAFDEDGMPINAWEDIFNASTSAATGELVEAYRLLLGAYDSPDPAVSAFGIEAAARLSHHLSLEEMREVSAGGDPKLRETVERIVRDERP